MMSGSAGEGALRLLKINCMFYLSSPIHFAKNPEKNTIFFFWFCLILIFVKNNARKDFLKFGSTFRIGYPLFIPMLFYVFDILA